VQHLDVELDRRVHGELVMPTEIDDPLDAVGAEGVPALVAQPPNAVGADDRAESGRPAVLGG
jgi:hypothetical protein